ncbi:polyketide cyclase / dehydrase and lipid transport [Candidatus Protofrankia californiensis]|uniref:polyketide cyclase / dehydrase and lipid transport n=1 Tax=Candidatus Protofrankia californiensis TaxID=1839754 RepID=UPI0019D07663|nr:polyketide cyclase / dehydrase and lipid transport [Candidatus Protofrankia californiensis]
MSPSPVQIDLIDEVFLAADPAVVSAAVHEPALWRALWPDLDLSVFQDRDTAGLRFTVTGALVGTSEIWLEPWGDGVVVHVFLRADATRRGQPAQVHQLRPRVAARWAKRRSLHTKRQLNALKDVLEAGREPGEPAAQPARPAAPAGPAMQPAGPAAPQASSIGSLGRPARR